MPRARVLAPIGLALGLLLWLPAAPAAAQGSSALACSRLPVTATRDVGCNPRQECTRRKLGPICNQLPTSGNPRRVCTARGGGPVCNALPDSDVCGSESYNPRQECLNRLPRPKSDIRDIMRQKAPPVPPPSPIIVLEWGACDPVPIRQGVTTRCPLYATIENESPGTDVQGHVRGELTDRCYVGSISPTTFTIPGSRPLGRYLVTTVALTHGTCPPAGAAPGATTVPVHIRAIVQYRSGGQLKEEEKEQTVLEQVD